ncbi:MAG: glycosyltransferase family 4 protein [Candidatus Omnitrophica bacterium]|nr:glycosyltransferase family 4 protein [Candidatus Omnitrophota bacterium]
MPNKRIKILFIITYLELGGAQKQLLSILKTLSPHKYSLTLCAGGKGYLKSKFLNLPWVRIKLFPSLVREVNPFLDLAAFLKLFFFIKKNKFDIIHTHSPKASILGRWAAYLAGVRNIIYTVHGWPFHKFLKPLTYYLYLFLERVTAKITKKIIVVSYADLAQALRKKICHRDKVSLIHYGVEIEKFDKVYKEREGKIPSTIITISCLKPQKGIFYFLQTAKALLKDNLQLNFIIAGDGYLRKQIEKEIKLMKLEDNVRLAGWVDDIIPLFKQASIFVLTSLWEGLPLSLIEAVISGVPVVVTNTQGLLDIVDYGKQGIVVNAGNPIETERACREILKDYQRWSRIIRANRDRLDLSYWSDKRMVKEVENIMGSDLEM